MSAQHVDLGALPFKGSTLLTAWREAREAERNQRRAATETRSLLATMRGHGSARLVGPRRAPNPAAALPQGAFEVVSGERFFGAGETDRLTAGWASSNTSINADLERSLATMRGRSRNWAVNTDIGRRYLQLCKDNVIGSKVPRLQVRATLSSGSTLDEAANSAVESAFMAWARRGVCEISGQLGLVDVCRTLIAAAARDGEFLVRRIRDRRLPYGYALQVLDIDRLPTMSGVQGSLSQVNPGNTVRMGVEIDTLGRPQYYHLHSQHPVDSGYGIAPSPQTERIPANEIFHGFVAERPEQLRGYPWTAAILKRADGLDKYEGFALVAAQVGAAKMGFYVTDKDAPNGEAPSFEDYKDATGKLVQEVEAGMLEALPPGVDFKSFDPDYPHQNFDSFVTTCLRGIAAGLNVAHHNLTGNMNGVNYSSARIAELAEREHWRGVQGWFIECFLRPMFEEWLGAALLTGTITLPSGVALPAERKQKFAQAATFQPRGWSWVDPEADIKAASLAIDNDLRSRRQVADEQGVDLDDVIADRRKYLDDCAAAGVEPVRAAVQTSAPTKPANPGAPA